MLVATFFARNQYISWRLLRVGFVMLSVALLLAACQPALTGLPAGELRTFALAPTGEYLAVGGAQGVYVYHLGDGKLLWAKRTPYAVESLTFNPDGTQLLGRLADLDNITLLWWQADDGRRLRKRKLNFSPVGTTPVNWSPDGKHIVLDRGTVDVFMFDVPENRWYVLPRESEPVILPGPGVLFWHSTWSPDGKCLAFAVYDKHGSIEVWDVDNNTLAHVLFWQTEPFLGIVAGMTFDATGTRLATTDLRKKGMIWDLESQTVVLYLEAPSANPIDRADFPYSPDRVGEDQLVWSPDDRWLVTGTRTGTIIVWDATTGAIARVLLGHTTPVLGLSFRPDNGHLLSASQNEIFEWDVATGTRLDTFAHLLTTP